MKQSIASIVLATFTIQSGVAVGRSSNVKSLPKILSQLPKARRVDRFRIGGVNTSPTPSATLTTLHPGCQYNGQYYPLNSRIYSGEDQQHNWCFGAICDGQGQVLQWDDFNCFPTTTQPTTTPPTPTTTPPPSTTTPPLPPGCQYDGQYFPPNSEIYSGEDNNWCYGAFCDGQGHILHWDDFNCFPTTTESTTPTITTTIPPTPPTNTNNSNNNNNWFSKLWKTFSSWLDLPGIG